MKTHLYWTLPTAALSALLFFAMPTQASTTPQVNSPTNLAYCCNSYPHYCHWRYMCFNRCFMWRGGGCYINRWGYRVCSRTYCVRWERVCRNTCCGYRYYW